MEAVGELTEECVEFFGERVKGRHRFSLGDDLNDMRFLPFGAYGDFLWKMMLINLFDLLLDTDVVGCLIGGVKLHDLYDRHCCRMIC